MATHLDVSLQAIQAHGLVGVLLQAKSKMPASWCERCGDFTYKCHHYPGTRRVTQDLDELRGAAKIGVLGGAKLTVLDVDRPALFDRMCVELGRLEPTAYSGGVADGGLPKFHVWVAPQPGLPREIKWEGITVGEVISEGFYVTVPPALHHKTQRPARWIKDPRGPLPQLPDAWVKHLMAQAKPQSPDPGSPSGTPSARGSTPSARSVRTRTAAGCRSAKWPPSCPRISSSSVSASPRMPTST